VSMLHTLHRRKRLQGDRRRPRSRARSQGRYLRAHPLGQRYRIHLRVLHHISKRLEDKKYIHDRVYAWTRSRRVDDQVTPTGDRRLGASEARSTTSPDAGREPPIIICDGPDAAPRQRGRAREHILMLALGNSAARARLQHLPRHDNLQARPTSPQSHTLPAITGRGARHLTHWARVGSRLSGAGSYPE